MVASALGEFPAAHPSAGSDERSPHHVVERSTYAASDCAVFIEGLPRSGTPGRWSSRTGKGLAGLLRKGVINVEPHGGCREIRPYCLIIHRDGLSRSRTFAPKRR